MDYITQTTQEIYTLGNMLYTQTTVQINITSLSTSPGNTHSKFLLQHGFNISDLKLRLNTNSAKRNFDIKLS
jgi:hypothetical protein